MAPSKRCVAVATYLVFLALHQAGGTPPPRAGPKDAKGHKATRTDSYGDPLPEGAIARLGTVRLRSELRGASGNAVALSPDGKILAAAHDEVRLWDTATGKELSWLPPTARANAVAFTRDGKTLLTGLHDGSIQHWKVGTGNLLRRTKGEKEPDSIIHNMGCSFSADRKTLVVALDGGVVSLWDVASGKRKFHIKKEGSGFGFPAALSPDGRTLVIAGKGNLAHFIDTRTRKEIRQLKAPFGTPDDKPRGDRRWAGIIFWSTFSGDGKYLASAGQYSIQIWEATTGKLVHHIKGTRGRLAFSPNNRYLACGDETAIRLYEVATGKEARRFEKHAGWVYALAFSTDGQRLASGEDHTVSLWDVKTGKRVHDFAGHAGVVTSLAFSPDGRALASGGNDVDPTLILWDLPTRKPRYHCDGYESAVLRIAFSPDGRTVATGDGMWPYGTDGREAQIHLWKVSTGKLLRQFPGHLHSVGSLAFSPDGRKLASSGGDARAKVWEVSTGKRLLQIRTAAGRVVFSPNGKTLLMMCRGELGLWDVKTAQKVRAFGSSEDKGRRVWFATYLPDGKTVLSREEQGTRGENLSNEIRFWDADNGRLLRSFQISGRDGPYPFYALSPDGKTFAAPGDTGGGGLRLWDTISGRLLVHLKRPWYVTALAFSPDSKTLASGNWDTTVLLWDLSQIRLQSLWAKLAAGNDETARAIKRIEATPEKRVAFVKEALLRLATLERRVAVLITDLDNDSFKVRENASRNLEALGPGAEVAIRSALKAESSPEVSKRLREILTKLKQPKGTSRIMDPRSARVALAVLEEIGSPEARKVLRQLAKSQPGSWLTRGAAAALQRLEKRGQTPKKEKP